MSTEYEKILSLVNKLNKVEGEKCLICHFPDKSENLIKLSCNHFFHSKCLCLDHSKLWIKCPYCEKPTILNNNNISRLENIPTCTVILKSGINKGKKCNRKNCKYHSPILSSCTEILKSGPRKGEVCNRINCKYHSKIIKNTSVCTNIIV